MTTFKLKERLSDLFPPDDPNSSWLLRLAILRDDLEYELKLREAREDDPTGVWAEVYGLRKISITIDEVKHILVQEVRPYLETVRWPTEVVVEIRAMIDAVEALDVKLQPIRDALGGHVRPWNALKPKPPIDPTPEVLRAHGGMEFQVALDMKTGQGTSFCGLTAAAFLLAWPNVRTPEDYEKKREELRPELLFHCFKGIRHGIDLLMFEHWHKAGLVRYDDDGT